MTSASRPVSLRGWLQSSALLAVLAGYALLLAANQSLASFQRRQVHQQLADSLKVSLQQDRGADPDRRNAELSSLGLELQVMPLTATQQPLLRSDREGRQWLESVSAVELVDGGLQSLRLRQNVTDSVQREWIGQLLLIAAAGVSSLITSGLLRLVLLRGLVRPLMRLGQQLTSLNTSSLGQQHLAVESEPEELQPIALAFNDLQDRLAASWKREQAFVDGVAHELRTPITLISGRAQRLRRQLTPASPLTPTLDQIVAEAERMSSLVSVLLDLARQDSGRLGLQQQQLDLEELLLELYERLVALAPDRLRLLEPSSDGLPQVVADPERLQQCLTALVDNALRYSSGAVDLSVGYDHGSLVLHVRDRGPGVPDAEKQQIFQRFMRGTAAVNSRGSGIGLSVVQLLMEAMGGSVQVADAPGGGADFQLRLPPVDELTPATVLPSA
jgi:signal transduction histidine kinase